jgi:hypothetical protein
MAERAETVTSALIAVGGLLYVVLFLFSLTWYLVSGWRWEGARRQKLEDAPRQSIAQEDPGRSIKTVFSVPFQRLFLIAKPDPDSGVESLRVQAVRRLVIMLGVWLEGVALPSSALR